MSLAGDCDLGRLARGTNTRLRLCCPDGSAQQRRCQDGVGVVVPLTRRFSKTRGRPLPLPGTRSVASFPMWIRWLRRLRLTARKRNCAKTPAATARVSRAGARSPAKRSRQRVGTRHQVVREGMRSRTIHTSPSGARAAASTAARRQATRRQKRRDAALRSRKPDTSAVDYLVETGWRIPSDPCAAQEAR